MSRRRKILFSALGVLAVVVIGGYLTISRALSQDPFMPMFVENCASCHGEDMHGNTLGPALIGADLQHGDSVSQLTISIAHGFPDRGMPAWSNVLEESQIQSMAILIAERRVDRRFVDFKVNAPLDLPTGHIASEKHNFKIETVAIGLDALPYSIAPLPDGSILVTEKTKGLRIVSASGEVSELVSGTPKTHDANIPLLELKAGYGWMMEVAPHPDYANNGWIYIHYGDRCTECDSTLPVSMNRLIRGRIKAGAWVDEEVIWEVDKAQYTSMPDMAAGGRISFDDAGHVFISVGFKGPNNYEGIQDLSQPYGKIHRMHDDGQVPLDNPFMTTAGAYKTTWTYGHRSPQGLEYNVKTGALWATEMGPRGGDEVNLLLPGKNYGWPLYSKGVDYDGTPVEYGKELNIEFDLADIQQPVVDLTPAPAVSSFTFYRGSAFPDWQDDLLVGTLKATELYRMEVTDNQVTHTEILLKSFARIRDVENGIDGNLYLLLEHASGGQIVRLVPVG